MFTIKAYAHDGSLLIYAATQIKISPNKRSLKMWEPQNTYYSEIQIGDNTNSDNDYDSVFIENEKGKTIESMVRN